MIKKFGITLYCLILLVALPFIFYIILNATSISSEAMTLTDNRVVYNLPYTGILPDHPLYIFKAIRDKVLDLMTRDNVGKAQLYLLFADKRASMALQLEEKGKNKLAIDTLSKGEKYFEQIPTLLLDAKKQGGGAPLGLIDKIRLSNQKHREVIETLAREIPQGNEKDIDIITKLNEKIAKELKKL